MIAVILIFLLIILYFQYNKIGEYFTNYNLKFSDVTEDISDGNIASWSNKMNPFVDKNIKIKGDIAVIQGSGVPLGYEHRMPVETEPKEKSMFFFSDYYSSPLCCPSVYSTSNGCVCFSNYSVKYGEKPEHTNVLNYY